MTLATHKSVFGTVAAFAVLMAVVPQASPASIFGGPGQGAIAFDSRSGGDADLFIRAPDGTRERRLEASIAGANDSRPAWAPEPLQRVEPLPEGAVPPVQVIGVGFLAPDYFVAGGPRLPVETVEVTVDGSPLTAGQYQIDSDQQMTINAFPPGTSSRPVICVRKRAGMAVAPGLTVTAITVRSVLDGLPAPNDPGRCPAQPIAYQSDVTGNYEIWLYDPAIPVVPGANPVNVSRAPASQDTAPTWSSADAPTGIDGGVSAFASVRQSPLLAYVSDRDGDRNLYVLDPARPLSETNPAPLTTHDGDDANPDWSPDGRNIVFQSDRLGVTDLWTLEVVESAGSFLAEHNLRQVTADEQPAYDPTWHANVENEEQDTIAFAGPEDVAHGGCQLQLIYWASGPPPMAAEAQLTSNGHADAPAFLPYADAISVQSAQGGGAADVWLYPLPEPAGPDPTWSPFVVRTGEDGHPNWQGSAWAANVFFNPPKGRASRRKRRRPSSAVLAAHTAQAGTRPCASPPSASFQSRGGSPVAGRATVLDATRSSDTTGPIERYEWDLDGDGSFETRGAARTVDHTFARTGRQVVALRVVDLDGESAIVRRSLTTVSAAARAACARFARGANVVAGTSRKDDLRGTRRRDVMCGFGGNDRLRGLGGNDVLVGGRGADRLEGQRGADRASGGAGRDRLAGGSGADRLRGGAGPDRLIGHGGRDRLFGGGGRDRLFARDRRRDRISGGPQRDRAVVDGRRDRVTGVETVIRR
jgi:hypothetical protein